MTPEQATDLAERTLAAIPDLGPAHWTDRVHADHRERVASDLRAIERAEEGLRACKVYGLHAVHAPRYTEARDEAWENLRRTARLYGVTP